MSKRKKHTGGPRMVACITINTDASFSYQHKVGSYAFVIVCDHFRIKHSGTFTKAQPTNPTDAEIMSIGNALHTLLKRQDVPTSAWLIINTDSKAAMNVIQKGKNKLGADVRKMIDELKVRIQYHKFEFRHVKAHSGKGDARSLVNEWCDMNAKIHLSKSITELLGLSQQLSTAN